MQRIKSCQWFKAISLIVVVTFFPINMSWADPANGSAKVSTLATPDPFQAEMPSESGAIYRNSLFSDMRLCGSLFTIAKYLLIGDPDHNIPPVPHKRIAAVLNDEGIPIADGIDTNHIWRKDDNTAIIWYTRNGRVLYRIEIALNDGVTSRGPEWVEAGPYIARARFVKRLYDLKKPVDINSALDIERAVSAELDLRVETSNRELFDITLSFVPASMPKLQDALKELGPLPENSSISIDDARARIGAIQARHGLDDAAAHILWIAWMGPAEGMGGVAVPGASQQPNIVEGGAPGVYLEGSFSHEEDVRREQETVQIREESQIAAAHKALREAADNQTLNFIGQESDQVIQGLIKYANLMLDNEDKHVVFIGQDIDASAPFLLQALTLREDWNIRARKKGRPQVHFMNGFDSKAIADLSRRSRESGEDKIRVVYVGEASARSTEFLTEIERQYGIKAEAADANIVTANTVGLLAAGIVTDSSVIKEIHHGARKRHQEWLALEDAGALAGHDAYKLAASEVRMAKTGQNVSVFMIFSMRLRYFSIYMAQLYNKAVGDAGLDVWFSGENPTYLHSTQQAHKQAVPFPHNDQLRERARHGFISLTFLNPQEEGDVAVNGPAHPMLRGFGFRFLMKITRAAYRLSMRLSHRPIVEVNFEARNAEDLGRLLHFAQVSSAMAGKLAGSESDKDTATGLEKSIDSKMANIPTETHEDGILAREQNILNFSEHNGQIMLGGILGDAMETQAAQGGADSDVLRQFLSVMSRIPSKLESKVIKPYRSGTELEHLNTEKIKKEAEASAGMAELFKNKKRIYAISIGGSTTGPLMVNALGLTGGPEIIEVQSYDADMIERIKKDIDGSKDPSEIGVVIISKSGVTTETDVNGWTIVDALMGAFQRKTGNADEVKNHVLIITDPQVGTLCKKAKSEGWRLLAHPVLIGGRWSMFSSVGLFYYFLKGGTAEDLENAVQKLEAQHKVQKLDGQGDLQGWDAHLADVLKKIDGYKGLLDPEKSASWDERKKALRDIVLLLSNIPGVWEGILDYMVNTIPILDRDTELAMALDRSYENLVSHTHPFGAQLRAESKSKPGIQFYSAALWGWNAIKDAWNRILSDRRVYAALYGIAAPQDQAGSYGARLEKASWDAVIEGLDAAHQPYVAVRTGPMSAANLLSLMHYQYLRLAVDMALYEPMDHKSEGQPGVDETKNIARAEFADIASIIMDSSRDENERARKRLDGVPIPEIQADQIEHKTEVPMNLHESLGMEEELTRLVENFIRGSDAQHHGILSQATLEEIKRRPNNEIPGYLHQLFLRHFSSMPNMLRVYIDDEKPAIPAAMGARWIVRATSLENWANLEHGTANGSNVGIYEYVEGKLVLRASIQVLWGSSVRVTISNGTKTQDFKLKGDGKRIVEIDRPGEDNSVIMGQKGTYIALGGLSHERPMGFQRFENEILRPSLNTAIRFSDSLSADTGLMMNKPGMLAEWMTRAEAFELSQIMQAASGCVMTMTEEGLRRVSDLAISEKDLDDKTQIYVYAGTSDQVLQVEVFMNYLCPSSGKYKGSRSLALDTLDAFLNIPQEAPAALRAAAIMWTLRLKQGLEVLPPVKGLKGDIKETVSQAQEKIKTILDRLDREATIEELKSDYLALAPNARRQEAAKYVLLGHPEAGMMHNPRIAAGEQMKLVYELSEQFERASAWALLENVRRIAQIEGYDTSARDIDSIQAHLRESYKTDSKVSEKPKDQLPQTVPFGESFEKYIKDAAGVPEMVRQKLGLSDAKLPESACDVLNRMVDVYLHDQEVGDASDERVKELQKNLDNEHEIFYQRDGKVWVHNLHWIRQNIEERKSGAMVNKTGDVSSRLDEIYNYVLIYFAQPLVDTIISEEEGYPVKGFQRAGKDEPRLILFIDPIDGSSQIKEAGTFGMIFTIGVLLAGQDLNDFEPRKQILASMDVQFGWPRTLLRFVNRARVGRSASPEAYGRPEVMQFELTQNQEGTGEAFRKQSRYEPLTTMEEGANWDGLLLMPQPGKGLGVAMGGSFIDSRSDDGHREVVGWLQDTYGYRLGYTGCLVDDIGTLLRASPKLALGAFHTYGPTGKHRNGRFRLTFEEWHYSLMFEALGGEVSDGLQPMLDNQMTGDEPSAITKPFYASNRWVSKFVMAWRNYAKENLEGKVSDEGEMAAKFRAFLDRYTALSRELIIGVVKYSEVEKRDVMPVTDKMVRDALLGQHGNIFELLMPESGESTEAHIARIYRLVSEWAHQTNQRIVPPAAPSGDTHTEAPEMIPNNTTTAVIETAERLVPGYIDPTQSASSSMLTDRVEGIIEQVESAGGALSPENVADLQFLKENLYGTEAQSINEAVLVKARTVMKHRAIPGHAKEVVIIGLETDWIPTMKDQGHGTQHDAMNPLMVRLQSLKDVLKSENLEDAVEFVYTDANKLADSLLDLAAKTGTPYTNIIAIGSVNTIESPGFNRLRSTPREQRALLAAISDVKIIKWYEDHASEISQGQLPDIDLMRIMSIVFEVSQGKNPPPGTKWDERTRMLILEPEPTKAIDCNELPKINKARALALMSA